MGVIRLGAMNFCRNYVFGVGNRHVIKRTIIFPFAPMSVQIMPQGSIIR